MRTILCLSALGRAALALAIGACAAPAWCQPQPSQQPGGPGAQRQPPADPAQKPSTGSQPAPPPTAQPQPGTAAPPTQAPGGGGAVTPGQGTVQGSRANPVPDGNTPGGQAGSGGHKSGAGR